MAFDLHQSISMIQLVHMLQSPKRIEIPVNYHNKTSFVVVDKSISSIIQNCSLYRIGGQYPAIRVGKKCILLHRFVWFLKNGKIDPNKYIDHLDGNINNCIISNLREVDNQTNCRNRHVLHKKNSSGYNGVSKAGKYWRAYVKESYRQMHLGMFIDKKDAAIAHDKYSWYRWGKFTYLNFPENVHGNKYIYKTLHPADKSRSRYKRKNKFGSIIDNDVIDFS